MRTMTAGLGLCAALVSVLGTSAPAAAGSGGDVRLEWEYRVMGEGIGAAGLDVVDLAGNGVHRVVATGIVGGESYWYVLVARSGGYEQEWASEAYEDPIGSVQVAQLDDDPALEVVVGVGNRVLVYDGATHALQSSFPTTATRISSLVVADPDADGSKEAVFCSLTQFNDPGPLFVVDATTGTEEYRGDAYPCSDVSVGNVRVGAAPEIVLGRENEPSFVLDGSTHAALWTYTPGFGYLVRLADLDGDGTDEIVSGNFWYGIRIFDADSHTLTASIPTTHQLAALRVVDVDGDGRLEIVHGDGQWGSLYVRDGATRAVLWSVTNPDHGVTNIAAGDADDDGTSELLWGAGYSTSGADYLYVVDTASHAQEWRSQDVTGPFLALSDGDVDGDGAPEIVYGSYSSDSDYGNSLYFVRDAATRAIEFASGALSGRAARIRNANVDADPQQELLVLTSATLSCVDGLTHLEQWHWTGGGASLELADVDLDGRLEAVVGGGAFVYQIDAATGALEWQSPDLGQTDLSLLRVANVDGDPQPEIVVASFRYPGGVFVLDRVAGTTQALGSRTATALDTPDRDGDGVHEIVVGTDSGQVLVLDTAGGLLATLGTYGERIDGLAIADVDGDGAPETVFAVDDELFVYGRSGEMLWRSRLLPAGFWPTWTVAERDSLRVADLDGDGFVEILVSVATAGVRVYEVRSLPTPRLAVADVAVPEGDGPGTAVFTVTLSPASTSTVTVDYATAGGTATPGADYVSVSGTLTFPPGTTSRTVEVPIRGDFVYEDAETFVVRLSGAAFALLDHGEAIGTIGNDDAPGFVVDDVTVQEPEAGTATATFTVTLAPASGTEASVDFATEDGTAAAPGDYAAVSGRLTFPPGTTTRTIEVTVEADAVVEAIEAFGLRLGGAVGADVARALGTGTIRDFGGAGFYTVPPCRAVDTRHDAWPPLPAKRVRHFTLAGSCGVPSTARAVALNVTVAEATAAGNLRLFARGTDLPGTSVLNYTPGLTRANNAVVKVSPWAEIDAYASQPAGTVHLILDVTGYFE